MSVGAEPFLGVLELCRNVDTHLRAVLDEIARAAETIVETMVRTDTLAEAMLADLDAAPAGTQMDALAEQLASYLAERDARITVLLTEAGLLGGQLRHIEQVSRATTTLAANALVEAGLAGHQGASAVAGEIQGLAERAATAAEGVGARIAGLTERLSALPVTAGQAR